MKGPFNLKPTVPRYNYTWDISKLLEYLRKLSALENLNLKLLKIKTFVLQVLTTVIHLNNLQRKLQKEGGREKNAAKRLKHPQTKVKVIAI